LVFASHQLFRLEEYNALRASLASQLNDAVEQVPGLTPPAAPDGCQHVYHMYRFRLDPVRAGMEVSQDQFREALKHAFAAGGLPLVEFPNVPLRGHALLRRGGGSGRGGPWACQGRGALTYRVDAYPGALDAIRGSLVVGYPARAPLTSRELVGKYCECFVK